MNLIHSLWRVIGALFAALALPPSVVGQCATPWSPGDGLPGTNGGIFSTTVWDPDGPGPLGPLVVVAGDFTVVGSVQANGMATYDPASGVWSALGPAVIGDVSALTALPNGDLLAARWVHIERWNGTSWSVLGAGDDYVRALTTLPNGDLVAGGDFTTFGGIPASGVARWNGSNWSALGSGIGGDVWELTTLPNGDLVAGGFFTTAGGVSANNIARWDGASWSALGMGMDSAVSALMSLPNGDLVAGGYFTTAGGVSANYIARWNGTNWSALGSGMDWEVYALTTLPNGDIVAGGDFITAGGVPATGIARWNGATWSALGTGMNGLVWALTALPNGDLVAGGGFTTAGGVPVTYLARWSGTNWSALATGMNGTVKAVVRLPNGDLVAGGKFTRAGGVLAHRIARWDGTAWAALGTGLGAGLPSSEVTALTTLSNGDLVAGGEFVSQSGSGSFIARWDGTSWSALGSGSIYGVGDVHALTTLPNGDLVVGGNFPSVGGVLANKIARWDGANWSALGTGMNGSVSALLALPNGDLVAGGGFTTAGGVSANYIARWDGASWSALGSGTASWSLTAMPNGDIVASAGPYITRWNGTSWSTLGIATNVGVGYEQTLALAPLPNGDLVVGGAFSMVDNVSARNIARWDGTSWTALGTGLGAGQTLDSVEALTTLPNGDLVVGGNFLTAGGLVSAFVARLTTTCPATSTGYGVGCASSGGNNTLTATTLPWVDSTFRATGTGLPAAAVAITLTSVTSFPQGALPLSLAFVNAVPGCDVLVAPDILGVLLTFTGSASTELFLPNTPPLVGVTFYHQWLLLDLGPGDAATATNALQLTAGMF